MKRRTLMLLLICGALPSAHAQLSIGKGFGGVGDLVFTVVAGARGNTCTLNGSVETPPVILWTPSVYPCGGGTRNLLVAPSSGSITLQAGQAYHVTNASIFAAWDIADCRAEFVNEDFNIDTMRCAFDGGGVFDALVAGTWKLSCSAGRCFGGASGPVTVTL